MTSQRFGSEERIALTGLVIMFLITAAWWALALWPVADSPAWLTRTRYVCFGVGESGLPDAGGWIGLTAGPIGMLGILLVGWGRAVRAIVRRARSSFAVATVLSLLVLGSAALIAGAGLRVRQAQARQFVARDGSALPPSNYPRLNKPAPALELIAHDGRELQLTALRGRPVLLTFAYAHCTTVCPVIVRDVLVAQQLLAQRGEAPVVLVVTLDPWRDTPSRLVSMARDWKFPGQDAWMLGGTVDDVTAALAAWQVPTRRDERTGEVIHPALAYVIDRDGQIAFAATGGAETLAELVRRVDRKS